MMEGETDRRRERNNLLPAHLRWQKDVGGSAIEERERILRKTSVASSTSINLSPVYMELLAWVRCIVVKHTALPYPSP